jgi:hypothetical protein
MYASQEEQHYAFCRSPKRQTSPKTEKWEISNSAHRIAMASCNGAGAPLSSIQEM